MTEGRKHSFVSPGIIVTPTEGTFVSMSRDQPRCGNTEIVTCRYGMPLPL